MLQYSYRPQSPATRRTRTGDDQTWVDYLPMPERPRIVWPNNARIAVWMCPNVLFYELNSPPDPWINAWSRMTPDVMMYGRQEFGPRVGFWRMLDVLDKHGIPCTAVLNVAALAPLSRYLQGAGRAPLGPARPRHDQHAVHLRA